MWWIRTHLFHQTTRERRWLGVLRESRIDVGSTWWGLHIYPADGLVYSQSWLSRCGFLRTGCCRIDDSTRQFDSKRIPYTKRLVEQSIQIWRNRKEENGGKNIYKDVGCEGEWYIIPIKQGSCCMKEIHRRDRRWIINQDKFSSLWQIQSLVAIRLGYSFAAYATHGQRLAKRINRQ